MAKGTFKRDGDSVAANALLLTKSDAGVVGNGIAHLFTSEKVVVNAGDNAVEIVVEYADNLPNPSLGQLARYKLTCIIETEDDAGNWHPIHSQFNAFVNPEDGKTFILKLDPSIFVIDTGVSNDISDGLNIIARECVKQGTLPDDFRICILVNEYGYDAAGLETDASFDEVKLTATYNTYSV